MTVKTTTRKAVILPDGTRINRIIQKIKYDNTLKAPKNVRGKVYIEGKLVDVVPVDEESFYWSEWMVKE